MQDGVSHYFPLVVRQFSNTKFLHKWIGPGIGFPWPARSPDFNPLHMPTPVHAQENNT